MQLTPEQALDLSLLEEAPGERLGVAVSGGGDSVALLQLLHAWGGRDLAVVTVDHGLREESLEEAKAVGVLADSMGYSHQILSWDDWDKSGNLQDEARRARRRLMASWARREGISAVVLGHTADDQAETFLMRLARGSGVDGLASMEPLHHEDGISWLRPMLGVRRADLRSYLSQIGASYVDDPSNEDESYDRIKVRRALGTLGALGIDVPKISETTERLRSAKQVVYTATRDLAQSCCALNEIGELRVDLERLLSGQQALQHRIVSEAVRFVSGSYYAPRAYMVAGLLEQVSGEFTAATLHGCIVRPDGEGIVIRREPGKTEGEVPLGSVWDGRWLVSGSRGCVRSLGEAGLAETDWRESGWAREALLTIPAVWEEEKLIAVPLLGFGAGYEARISLTNPFFNA